MNDIIQNRNIFCLFLVWNIFCSLICLNHGILRWKPFTATLFIFHQSSFTNRGYHFKIMDYAFGRGESRSMDGNSSLLNLGDRVTGQINANLCFSLKNLLYVVLFFTVNQSKKIEHFGSFWTSEIFKENRRPEKLVLALFFPTISSCNQSTMPKGGPDGPLS